MTAPDRDGELESAMRKAVEFHGHLGPFLVIGVRMGNLARRILRPEARDTDGFEATLIAPLAIPFTCVIDGIQVTTNCTVGNQRLRIQDSRGTVSASFKRENVKQTLKIIVNPDVVKQLIEKMSEANSVEVLAHEIAAMPEDHLFIVKKS